eukprot:TRINITY_DN10399_c0_g1_i1.p1 TRINITY_DN10399_c0_g1~~TRINITY_DN10399_c0_g1_i1.p1  ORF type:complete len:332 (-),score=89.58 TRINITY_DN10399_c0_g1_i1:61-1023(-)
MSQWQSFLDEEVRKLDEPSPQEDDTHDSRGVDAKEEEKEEKIQDESSPETEKPVANTTAEASSAQPRRTLWSGIRPSRGGSGYEFREGARTPFPEITLNDGESDVEAAFRVGKECRQTGVVAFGDGSSFVAAQEATDAWGQGLLALHRCRNLRNRAIAEEELPVSDSGPNETDLDHLELGLRLNIAQALLKLRQFENSAAHCEAALEINPENLKGLWRHAKAVWGLRCPGDARQSLDKLLELEPGNLAAKALLVEIEAEEQKRLAKRSGKVGTQRQRGNTTSQSAPIDPAESEQGSSATADLPSEDRSFWHCCKRRSKQH